MTYGTTYGRLNLRETIRAQCRIIVAIMLHDVKSRFGGSALGFLAIGIGWPLGNVLILVVVNAGLGRAAPYGDSAALWYATGCVPFMAFQYMSRYLSLAIFMNKGLLSLPIVKITDLIFARAIVEVLNAGIVIILIFIIFWSMGIDFMPVDVVQASLAMLSMFLLGLGVGVINAVIAGIFPIWAMVYTIFAITFWITSGVLFVPDALPVSVQQMLAYLPWLQGVEWMRSAYYEGYGSAIIDKPYMIACGVVILFLGLASDRLLRGKMLH